MSRTGRKKLSTPTRSPGTTVHEGEIDQKALGQLALFPGPTALEILDQFEHSGLGAVRNKSAYLCGVMTRFRRQPGPRQAQDVQARLDNLFRSGKIRASDLDQRCYEALSSLSPAAACRMLDRFAQKDVGDVRNMSAFFMAGIKQAQQGQGDEGPMRGPAAGGPPPPYGMPAPAPAPPAYPVQPPPAGPFAVPAPAAFVMPPQAPFAIAPALAAPGPVPGVIYATQQPGGLPPGALVVAPPGGLPGAVAPGTVMVAYAPQPAAVVVAAGPGGLRNYAMDQYAMGVRTQEFHELSVWAQCVAPAAALKLQQLWDSGVRLVAQLDDRAWEALAELQPAEALSAIDEVAEALARQDIRNVNAFFMSVARKHLEHKRGLAQAGVPQPGAFGMPGPSYGAPVGALPPQMQHNGAVHPRPGRGLDALSPAVRLRVQELLARPYTPLNEAHFDEGVVEALRRLQEAEALEVLGEVAGTDANTVRNMPAYIMGICKRHKSAGRA